MYGGLFLFISLIWSTVATSDVQGVEPHTLPGPTANTTPPEKVEIVDKTPELRLRVLEVGESSIGHSRASVLLSPTYLPILNLVALHRAFIDHLSIIH